MLQLVHRPTIRHVIQSLLRRHLVPLEVCATKIKRNFGASQQAAVAQAAQQQQQSMTGEKESIEQTSLKVCVPVERFRSRLYVQMCVFF